MISESIFNAIDAIAAQGLEAMLQEVVRAETEAGDYFQAAEARYHLKRIELGLPEEDKQDDPLRDKAGWEQANEAWRNFYVEAAELYKRDEKWKEAAYAFWKAGRHREAIEMYVRDGSEESLQNAAFFAIKDIDPKLALDIFIKQKDIAHAFQSLEDIRSEDRQKFGEYLIRILYTGMVFTFTATIEEREGKKPEASEPLELLTIMTTKKYPFNEKILGGITQAEQYLEQTIDPETMRMGIELLKVGSSYVPRDIISRLSRLGVDEFKITELRRFLNAKLTGSDEDIDYFIAKAEEEKRKGPDNGFPSIYAGKAIAALRIHRRYDRALEVAERFQPEVWSTTFGILKDMKDYDRLAAAWRKIDDPVNYALTLSKKVKPV